MRARQETSGTQTNLYLQPEDGYLQAKDIHEGVSKLRRFDTSSFSLC